MKKDAVGRIHDTFYPLALSTHSCTPNKSFVGNNLVELLKWRCIQTSRENIFFFLKCRSPSKILFQFSLRWAVVLVAILFLQMLTKLTVVTISQHRQISDRYVLHLKRIQCYRTIMSIKNAFSHNIP